MVKESYDYLGSGWLSLGVRPLWVTTLALVIGHKDYHALIHQMAITVGLMALGPKPPSPYNPWEPRLDINQSFSWTRPSAHIHSVSIRSAPPYAHRPFLHINGPSSYALMGIPHALLSRPITASGHITTHHTQLLLTSPRTNGGWACVLPPRQPPPPPTGTPISDPVRAI